MWLIIVIFVILAIIVIFPKKNTEGIKITDNVVLSNFTTNKYVMTQTELIFYRKLKEMTDKMEMNIFPQINLERIIETKNKNNADRNRIKSRSIDYTIVNNKNCKIICCIELDDNSHNRESAKKADKFKDDIFKQVNIPLYRIKVTNNYESQLLEWEKQVKELTEIRSDVRN